MNAGVVYDFKHLLLAVFFQNEEMFILLHELDKIIHT